MERLKKETLRRVWREINEEKIVAYTSTAWGLARIVAVNPNDWTIKAYFTDKNYPRLFYAIPDATIFVEEKEE